MFVAVQPGDHQPVEELTQAGLHQDPAGEGLGVAQHLHDVGVLEDRIDRPAGLAREGGRAEFGADIALHHGHVLAMVAIDLLEVLVIARKQGADLGEALGEILVGGHLGGAHRCSFPEIRPAERMPFISNAELHSIRKVHEWRAIWFVNGHGWR